MIKLYFARDELEKALCYIIVFILIYFAIDSMSEKFEDFYFSAKISDSHVTIDGIYFTWFLEASIAYCILDFMRLVFKYHTALLVKHDEVQYSQCTCDAKKKKKWLLFASHCLVSEEYEQASRLKFHCPACRKMIYHCNAPKK